MKCIQVNLNGEPLWTVGHEKVDDLVFHLTYAPDSDSVHISAHGLFPNKLGVKAASSWEQVFINTNDVVTLHVTESLTPTVTASLLENDAEAGESELGLCCSFCGKNQEALSKLVAGTDAFICDECINRCLDIVRE